MRAVARWATSRLGGSRAKLPPPVFVPSRVCTSQTWFVDDDALPTTDLSLRLSGRPGMAVGPPVARGTVALLSTPFRVGQEGRALVFSADRRLIAHGDPGQRNAWSRPPGRIKAAHRPKPAVLEKAPDTAVNYYDFFRMEERPFAGDHGARAGS